MNRYKKKLIRKVYLGWVRYVISKVVYLLNLSYITLWIVLFAYMLFTVPVPENEYQKAPILADMSHTKLIYIKSFLTFILGHLTEKSWLSKKQWHKRIILIIYPYHSCLIMVCHSLLKSANLFLFYPTHAPIGRKWSWF